jgi:hypothetical protein
MSHAVDGGMKRVRDGGMSARKHVVAASISPDYATYFQGRLCVEETLFHPALPLLSDKETE